MLLSRGYSVARQQRFTGRASLIGLGGVGKTTLAKEYVYLHLAEYEHVCWVNAEGDDPSASFAALSEDPLGLNLPRDATIPDRVRAVKARLESGGPHLIVFDNVEHVRTWKALVPSSSDVRVLVTTRREDLDAAGSVSVGVLSEDQATELLLGRKTWPKSEQIAAKAIGWQLGHLPLALALAGRLLQRPGAMPSRLLILLRSKGAVQWSEHPRGPDLLEKNPSLVQLFDTSLQLLNEDCLVDQHAQRLLWVAGWFAPVEIPKGVLVDAARRLAGIDVPAEIAEEGLFRLADIGLLRLDENGQVILHRLVREYAQVRGDVDAASAVCGALAALPECRLREAHALMRLGQYRPHLVAILPQINEHSPAAYLWAGVGLLAHIRVFLPVIGNGSLRARELAAEYASLLRHSIGFADDNLRNMLERAEPNAPLDPKLVGQLLARIRQGVYIFGKSVAMTDIMSGSAVAFDDVVSLTDIIDRVLSNYRPFINSRELEVMVDKDSVHQHGNVIGHEELLLQVVSNLIDNAVRHSTPRSKLRVGVVMLSRAYVLEFRNDAVWMPRSEALLLTLNSHRAYDAPVVWREAGTGLWLSKVILERLGMNLTVAFERELGLESLGRNEAQVTFVARVQL